MKQENRNVYQNKNLKFYIEKPDDWIFVPQPWTANFRARSFANNEELRDKLKNGVVPFIIFHKPHGEPQYPYPTAQCGCRINGFPPNVKLEEGLPYIVAGLKGAYRDCEIIEATPNYIVSGHRAIFIKMKFKINNFDGDPIECLGRTFMIFSRDYIFTIGLTGSIDEKYRSEEEFSKIIASLKIG